MTEVKKRLERGFSTLELAILFIIVGLLIVPFYTVILGAANLGGYTNRIELVRSGLAEYMRIYGVYPCPAVMDSTDVSADCVNATSIAGAGGGTVLVGAVPIEDLREAMSCTETSAFPPGITGDIFRGGLRNVKDIFDADADDTNHRFDKTDCLETSHIVDEYGHKILYAVTEAATNLGNFDPFDLSQANISIVDANGVPTTANNQFFVLVSHGTDGKGAVDINGQTVGVVCGVDAGLDNENCDGDAVFRDALSSNVAGNDYYDDIIDFSLAGVAREDNYWNWAQGATPNERNLYSTPHVRVILEQVPATGTVANDDLFVVNRGDVYVQVDGAVGGNLNAQLVGANGGNVESLGGDIISNAGDVVAATGDVVAETGNIRAAAGNVVADVGSVRAPSGSVQAVAGDVEAAVDISAGQEVVAPKFCYDPPMTPDCM